MISAREGERYRTCGGADEERQLRRESKNGSHPSISNSLKTVLEMGFEGQGARPSKSLSDYVRYQEEIPGPPNEHMESLHSSIQRLQRPGVFTFAF